MDRRKTKYIKYIFFYQKAMCGSILEVIARNHIIHKLHNLTILVS